MKNKANTKIIATLADYNCTSEMIATLYEKGMRVIRLNTAHLSIPSTTTMIDTIRSTNRKIAIMLDTKGPEIRTSGLSQDKLVEKGDTIAIGFAGSVKHDTDVIGVNYPEFVKDVQLGCGIMIDDGYIELVAVEKKEDVLLCEVINSGTIKNNKSVNVPDAHLNLPSLNPRDEEFIRLAAQKGVDFIAHSFVRNKEDILAVKSILLSENNEEVRIIAKIENRQGVDSIEEILTEAYGVLVARGDLGVEIPAEQVPMIQKQLVQTCLYYAKPVIIATQMLESMIQSPRPTRAEISDVANAVIDGADALMLSGETAYGKYPVQAVETMARIVANVEVTQKPFESRTNSTPRPKVQQYIAKMAAQAARDLNIKAFVIPTRSGATVREVSSYRCNVPIYAGCSSEIILRRLMLSFGANPFLVSNQTKTSTIPASLSMLQKQDAIRMDDLIVILFSTFGASYGSFNQIHINTLGNALDSYVYRDLMIEELKHMTM
jgi:pyruvate kinase